ncbi:class I SAM-dependent methyltransferase [Halomonas cibimaris]|uniref:Class I SAM-dependent methyltransferase n=1 Tax=Halomonas cibimaris TaxID=657012 RepID=A0ABP7L0W5_9GAMM
MFNTTAWNRIRYDLYAPVYDAVAERALRQARRASLSQIEWRPGMRVLLVGAGTGLDLPWLPDDIALYATDLSPAMVRRLQKRADALGKHAQIEQMDAERLTYADGDFDAVIMHLVLAVMPDPACGLDQAYRVLKSGGQLCVLDKFQPDARPAGLARRAANAVTSAIATDITRQARPLLEGAGFVIEKDTPVLLGSLVRALVARKPSTRRVEHRTDS